MSDDATKYFDDIQKMFDNAREAGCVLCQNPAKTDTIIIRVTAAHSECLLAPEPEDEEEEKETWH